MSVDPRPEFSGQIIFVSAGGLKCRTWRTFNVDFHHLEGHSYFCREVGDEAPEILEVGDPDLGFIRRALPRTLKTSFDGGPWEELDSIKALPSTTRPFKGRKFRWLGMTQDAEHVCRLLHNYFIAVWDQNGEWRFFWSADNCIQVDYHHVGRRDIREGLPPKFYQTWRELRPDPSR